MTTRQQVMDTIEDVISRGAYVLVTPDAQLICGDIEDIQRVMAQFVTLEKLPTEGMMQ